MLASAAAVGAVATGTFSAIVPALNAPPADAAEAQPPVTAALASTASFLPVPADAEFTVATLQPVTHDLSADGFAAANNHLARLDKGAVLAQQLAEQLAREQAAQAERQRLDALIAEGGLDGWIAEALDIMGLPQDLAPSVKRIIMAESGGNPRAINNWDSNARAGTPSQGLMQTIPSTFEAFVEPSLADRPITDPVANITAGVNYMIDRYGIDTLQAGGRTDADGDYVGY